MTVIASLKALRDVDGVIGSFVVDAEGALVARDLSQLFADDVLSDVGPRIRRMADGLSESGDAPNSVILHFKDHKLWLRPIDDATLCVLGAPQVNRPALRMALTLIARRIAAQLPAERASNPPPAVAAAPSPLSSTAPTPPPPATQRIDTLVSAPALTPPVPSAAPKKAMWRGRPVDE